MKFKKGDITIADNIPDALWYIEDVKEFYYLIRLLDSDMPAFADQIKSIDQDNHLYSSVFREDNV